MAVAYCGDSVLITKAISSDITKIPADVAGILFAVYDPDRKIFDDDVFRAAFE